MYDRIRGLREGKKESQKTVADALGMSQTGYSKYETGENDLSTKVLIELAKYYGVSTDYILGITDERSQH